jgi:hypothetical protein
MTTSQYQALESGGLSDHCMDTHPGQVCLHCGTCTYCMSGCQCDTPDDAAGCRCGGCSPHADIDADVTDAEDRIEAGQRRWAETGGTR